MEGDRVKIGFIGAGGMSQALASKWQGKHELFFSGRENPKSAETAMRFDGQSGTPSEAVAFGNVVVLAVRADIALEAIETAGGPDAFAGKVVVDITNPLSVETFLTTCDGGGSMTEAIAERLPGAYVGKAFNMCQISVWEQPDMTFDGRKLVCLFTAHDKAKDVIAELIADTGAEPLLVGDNEHAYQLEAAAAIVIKFLFSGRDPNTVMNFIQPEVKPVR